MNISELYRALGPTTAVPSSGENRAKENKLPASGPSEFEALLHRAQTPEPTKVLNLSQHAETRIKSRDIPWDAMLEKRISSGIDQAQAKGSREALILADNVAVIANVKSRTVVTAMNREQMKGRIFTNIDSAVLV